MTAPWKGQIEDLRVQSRTKTIYGIELYCPPRFSYFTDTQQSPGEVVFVPLETLEEISEAENSWGMGGGSAYLMDEKIGRALEAIGWAIHETKGGWHRPDDRRKRAELETMIMRLYDQARELVTS